MKRYTSGEIIDRQFKVLRHLDDGGMGHVYLVEDRQEANRKCALKLMGDGQTDETHLVRFLKEARLLKSLRNPHIVTYFDLGLNTADSLYLVMEYMPGGNLKDLLKKAKEQPKSPFRLQSGLTSTLALKLFGQCVEGLCAIHSAGIAHRDLKPANLLLLESNDTVLTEEECTLKLADFGISSRHAHDDPGLTRAGSFLGTMPYASPEHLRHVIEYREHPEASWDRSPEMEMKGDVFALGLILYELWAGDAFVPETLQRQIAGHTHSREKAALRALEETLNNFNVLHDRLPQRDPIFSLLRELLEREPERRPSSVDVLKRIKTLQSGDTQAGSYTIGDTGASGGLPPPDRVSPPSSTPSVLKPSPLAFVLPLLVGCGVGWLGHAEWMSSSTPPEATYSRASAELAANPAPTPGRKDNPTAAPAPPVLAAPTQAPTLAPPPPTPAPTPLVTAAPTPAPPSPTPAAASATFPEANTKVTCKAKSGTFPDEWATFQAGVKSPITKPPPRCYHDGKGGVYARWDAQVGTPVNAPAGGKVRILDSYFAGSQTELASCLTLNHGEELWSRLCGFEEVYIPVKKGDLVVGGSGLGPTNASARLTWEIYQTADPEGKLDKHPLDIRPLLK